VLVLLKIHNFIYDNKDKASGVLFIQVIFFKKCMVLRGVNLQGSLNSF
jgi:hypothetical protein